MTKNLWSERQSAELPSLVSVRDEVDQARYVVEQVLVNREGAADLKQQAVLFRTSSHSGPLEIELTRRNVPFVKFGGLSNILDFPSQFSPPEVDQGYTGEKAAEAARAQGIKLHVVKLPEARRGFILLPRRWVVERLFGWAARFRRLVEDYEVYASTIAGLHVVVFVCLMLARAADFMQSA